VSGFFCAFSQKSINLSDKNRIDTFVPQLTPSNQNLNTLLITITNTFVFFEKKMKTKNLVFQILFLCQFVATQYIGRLFVIYCPVKKSNDKKSLKNDKR
jgi:hypothetical protein